MVDLSLLPMVYSPRRNTFTVCNVALESIVSEMFGKSATAVTDYL